jgi:putative heme iron utilization protein
MSLFKKKFGKVFAMIRPLPDFTLFRLIPSGGLYVYGFGQALEVTWPPTKASAEIAASIRPVAIEKPA